MDSRTEIILVHGLWFRSWAMARLARRLRAAGFTVRGFNYRSTRDGLDSHARRLRAFARHTGERHQHFVGHSLGGLVILRMLDEQDSLPPGRVIFLGSPLRGSIVARKAARVPGATALMGKIQSALDSGYAAMPGGREAGMIAGTRSVGVGWMVGGTGGPGDGTVAVEETRASGLVDHCQLPVTHTSMLFNAEVARQTAIFLKTGAFDRSGT
mgnify:CR=1 FL=1